MSPLRQSSKSLAPASAARRLRRSSDSATTGSCDAKWRIPCPLGRGGLFPVHPFGRIGIDKIIVKGEIIMRMLGFTVALVAGVSLSFAALAQELPQMQLKVIGL